jgi:prepilin-type N-terminal cleavage/methylation domain-containing protein
VSARRGFTLLETMVALVILALVVLAYLELFGTTARATGAAAAWSRAVAYAEDGVERAKLDRGGTASPGVETLPGGFERRVEVAPWGDGLQVVTVAVALPAGGQYEVSRLVETR